MSASIDISLNFFSEDAMEQKERPAKILRIYITEDARIHGLPLYHAIINEAYRLKLEGAVVFRGISGFCAQSKILNANIVDLTSVLPIVVEVIEKEENLRKLIPFLDENLHEGFVMMEDITVIRYFPFIKK